MKKHILLIIFLLIGIISYEQESIYRARTILATEHLVPAGDTTVNPLYLGEIRYKASNNTMYYAQSIATTGWRWVAMWKVLTLMTVGGGSPILSPLSTSDSAKFKSPTSTDNSVIINYTDTTFNFSVRAQITSIGSGTASMLTQTSARFVKFNPPSIMSSYTLTLPTSPVAGDWVRIGAGGTLTSGTIVTTFTVSASATIVGTVATTLTYGISLYYFYDGTYWYRL